MFAPDSEIVPVLEAVASRLRLTTSTRQIQQLATHFSLLLLWNEKINLTSIRKPAEIAERHFEESLFLATQIPPPEGLFMDVGSGAGFPGLPLKIFWPAVQTILLEPNNKKATFLKEVVRSCGLKGIDVRAERIHEWVNGNPIPQAALVTMRAVRPEPDLLAALSKVLAPAGRIALMLAEDTADRLRKSPQLIWDRPIAIPNSLRRVVLLGRAPTTA